MSDAVYEMLDVTDDEACMSVGIWLSLSAALADLADVKTPDDISQDAAYREDKYFKGEIRRRRLGIGDIFDSKAVYFIEFTERYDSDADEYKLDRRDWT